MYSNFACFILMFSNGDGSSAFLQKFKSALLMVGLLQLISFTLLSCCPSQGGHRGKL